MSVRCDRAPGWAKLQAHYDKAGRAFDLRDAFAADPGRFAAFSQEAPHVFADLSKNLIDAPTEAVLMALARECGLEAHRDAMFAGEHINRTEDRAVLHTLLRSPTATPEVMETLDAMLAYAE
ncbi:MAG: glucose-6-phosphate isomerase, partial [Pararhizobium sp.]|nr:glucose-6-phosphate isomerase [Pararhizobium sp.]